jgi:hypothetical protein
MTLSKYSYLKCPECSMGYKLVPLAPPKQKTVSEYGKIASHSTSIVPYDNEDYRHSYEYEGCGACYG